VHTTIRVRAARWWSWQTTATRDPAAFVTE
jgi:hypothetical protein